MIKIPHLYRVEAGPLGPAKRPAAPSPADNPVVERWHAVDGKPHLEQNDRGQIRTKDFMNESNNPYPSVPDKNTIEPMKPYFDPAVDAQLSADGEEEAEDPWNLVVSVIRAELPRVLGLGVLDPEFQRVAVIEAADGVSKYWSTTMLRGFGERFKAVNYGLDIAKATYLRLVSEERMSKHAAPDLSPAGLYASAAQANGTVTWLHRGLRPMNPNFYGPEERKAMLDLLPEKRSKTNVKLSQKKISIARKFIEDIFSKPSDAHVNGTVSGLQLLMGENEKRSKELQELTRGKVQDYWQKNAPRFDL